MNGVGTRKPEVDFATEIGQGLVTEIRKLQITLQEKEERIKQFELSKLDSERSKQKEGTFYIFNAFSNIVS